MKERTKLRTAHYVQRTGVQSTSQSVQIPVFRIHGHIGVDPDPDQRIHASDQWIRVLDPDPAIFVIDLQDATNF
jgi:hypothetical protein